MKIIWFSLYNLVLALWVGGIAVVTFIVTPAIFKSYGRDMAGDIVGRIFPGYFLYAIILSAAALVLFFLVTTDRKTFTAKLSLALLASALIVNIFIVFKLHTASEKAKHEVASFERESSDSAARRKFTKLHALSATLNLLLLADGIALLVLASAIRK